MSGTVSPTRIGPYEIHREIGRGGMGVVFAGRDTRLDRDVAVKALPELLARHPDRLARFQREARLLASLNHPNIASIHGLEEIDGKSYLVLEYIDGDTLEAILKRRGALPVEEALAIALQIARAVEAAHERGVIHRDLKPANIKINSVGDVKVLDFGLAKALDSSATLSGAGSDLTQPPPGSTVATIPGLVLGSPGYLSPEQARGQPADRRTDVFSFGCLLYEMLTGISLFAGQSIGDSIGATLYKEPDWNALPANTPPTVRLLLRRCLKKDPRQRLRDMADARLDLEEAIADPTGSLLNLAAGIYKPPRHWGQRLAPAVFGVALLAAGLAAGWLGASWTAPAEVVREGRLVVRFTVAAPEGTLLANVDSSLLSPVAISPDGRRIAFGATVEGQPRVWIRELSTGESREVTSARGGIGPFFSPDGRNVGFYNDGRILRASLEGGPASPICRAARPNGRLAWLKNGRIVFTGGMGQGLYWVSAEGGEPTLLVETDREKSTSGQSKPILGFGGAQPLPDGRHVICSIWSGSTLDDYELAVVDSESGKMDRILQQAAMPAVLDEGILVFLRNATLLAVRFDLEARRPVGEPVPVLQGVLADSWAGDGQFSISGGGTIAYTPGGRTAEDRRLVRIARDGTATPLAGPDAFVGQSLASPDGRYLAVSTLRRKLELWVYDLERRTMALVSGEGEPYEPVWSPDGRELAYTLEGQNPAVVRKEAFSASPPKVILEGSDYYPAAWVGQTLVLSHQNWQNNNQGDIVTLDLDAPRGTPPQPMIATPASEGMARVSPDGQWLLYRSNVSGQGEVYLARMPFDGKTWQISVGGADLPIWDSQGQAYFVSDELDLFAAGLTLEPGQEPVLGEPERLFSLKPIVAEASWGAVAMLPDGSFVGVSPASWETEPLSLTVIANWGEEVAERLRSSPADR